MNGRIPAVHVVFAVFAVLDLGAVDWQTPPMKRMRKNRLCAGGFRAGGLTSGAKRARMAKPLNGYRPLLVFVFIHSFDTRVTDLNKSRTLCERGRRIRGTARSKARVARDSVTTVFSAGDAARLPPPCEVGPD